MSKPGQNRRRQARYLALQALYQWAISQDDISKIERQFLIDNEAAQIDVPFFQKLLYGVPTALDKLDETLSPHLDRKLSDIDPIELTILRLGCFELMECSDIPYRVVINEALELAKLFGAEEGFKYINAVLDAVNTKLSSR